MEKKIKNPFGKFIRNIILGFCLILSIFCFTPILNALTDVGNNDSVDASYTGNINIIVRAKDKNNNFRIDTARWAFSSANPFTGFNNGIDYYQFGGGALSEKRIYAKVGGEPTSGKTTDACYASKKYNVNANSKIYSTVQEPGGFVVGFFSNADFNAESVIQLGRILECKNIPDGCSTVYMLISNSKNFELGLNNKTFLEVKKAKDEYTWESNYAGSTSIKSSVVLGGEVQLNVTNDEITNKDSKNFDVYLRTASDGGDENVSFEIGEKYNVLLDSKGKIYLYKSKDDFIKLNSTSKLAVYFVRKPDCNLVCVNDSGQVQFDIHNEAELKKFADEVNKNKMNEKLGGNYVANAAWGDGGINYNYYPIGRSSSPFKGTFNGDGKTINNAIIKPYYINQTNYGDALKDFGLFGVCESATINNLNIGTITVGDNKWVYYWDIQNYYIHTENTNQLTVMRDMYHSVSYVGGLCGKATNTNIRNIDIENVKLRIFIAGCGENYSGLNLGGIVGRMDGNSSIDNVHITGVTSKDSSEKGGVYIQVSDRRKEEFKSGSYTATKGSTLNGFHSDSNTNYFESTGSLKVGHMYFGGAIGYSADSSITNTTIEEYNINRDEQKYGVKENVLAEFPTGHIYAGGLAGWADDSYVENCHINSGTQDFTGAKNEGYFDFGGLIGHIKATKDLGKIVDNCSSKNNIEAENMLIRERRGVVFYDDEEKNGEKDDVRVGGLAGSAESENKKDNNSINNYSYSGNITFGFDSHGGTAPLGPEGRYLWMSGLISELNANLKISNCYVYDTTIKISNAKITTGVYSGPSVGGRQNYVAALFYKADNPSNVTNCYAYNVRLEPSLSLNESNKWKREYDVNDIEINDNTSKLASVYSMENSFRKVNEEKYDGNIIPFINNSQKVENQQNNVEESNKSVENINMTNAKTIYGKLLGVLDENGKEKENYEFTSYGYNPQIQKINGNSNQSAPFLTTTTKYSQALQIRIDCTRAFKGELASQVIIENANEKTAFYQYDGYFFGTGVKPLDDLDTNKWSLQLPNLRGAHGESLSGYTLTPNDPVIHFNVFTEFTNEIVDLFGTSYTEPLTLYPVFAPKVDIYATTKLNRKLNNGGREEIAVGDRLYIDHFAKGVLNRDTDKDKIEALGENAGDFYEISDIIIMTSNSNLQSDTNIKTEPELKINNDSYSIYKYHYVVTFNSKDAKNSTALSLKDIRSLFGEIYTPDGITASFCADGLKTVMNKYENATGLFADGTYFLGMPSSLTGYMSYSYAKDGIAWVDTENGEPGPLGAYAENDGAKLNENTNLFINFWKKVQIHYAEIYRDENGEIVDKENYAAYYEPTNLVPIYQFYSLNNDKRIANVSDINGISFDLKSVIKTYPDKFGDLRNDENKLIYISQSSFVTGVPTSPSGKFDVNRADGAPEICLADGKWTVLTEALDTQRNKDYYQAYNLNAVIIQYYDYDDTELYKKAIMWNSNSKTMTIGGVEYGNEYYIYSYAEILSLNNLDYSSDIQYSFMGWKVTINNNLQDIDYFVNNNTSFTLNGEKFDESQEFVIKLYPIFVKDKNSNIVTFKENEICTEKDGEFQISTPKHLIYMSYYVNYIDNNVNIKLTSNINMNGYSNFLPIGFNKSRGFNGTFNGDSYTISNLKIQTLPSFSKIVPVDLTLANKNLVIEKDEDETPIKLISEYVGLFGYINAGKTQGNVNLIKVNFNKSNQPSQASIGGFAGYSLSNIANVLVEGSLLDLKVAPNYNYPVIVGGIVGQTTAQSVTECISKIKVNYPSYTREKFMWNYSTVNPLVIGTIIGRGGKNANNFTTVSNCFDLGIVDIEKLVTTSGLYSIAGVNDLEYSHNYYEDGSYTNVRNCYSYNTTNYLVNSSTNFRNNVKNNNAGLSTFFNSICPEHSGIDCDNPNCVWNQDPNINSGMPYLKNTGIARVNFVINSADLIDGEYSLTNKLNQNAYIVTDKDKERLDKISSYSSEENYKKYTLTQDYFVLENYSYENLLRLGVIKANNSYQIDGESNSLPFTYLRGYKFVGFNYSDDDPNSDDYAVEETDIIFSSNKATFTLEFEKRTLAFDYIFIDSNGVTHTLASEKIGSLFASNYTLFGEDIMNQINTSIDSNAMFDGLELYTFKVYVKDGLLDEDTLQLYYFMVSDNDVVFISNVGYLELISEYNSYWEFSVNEGGYYNKEEEFKVYINLTFKEIEYQLQFFESSSKIVDINSATSENYLHTSEGKLNDVIDYIEAPSISGYTFDSWVYYEANDSQNSSYSFLIDNKIINNFPALEKAPFDAQKANNGKYVLQLFPTYNPIQYTIEYFDGDKILATQIATFNDEIELFGGNEAKLQKNGYHIIGYELDYEYFSSNPIDVDMHNSNFNKLNFTTEKDLYQTFGTEIIEYIYVGNIRLNVQYARNIYSLEIIAQDTNGSFIDNDFNENQVFTIDYEIRKTLKNNDEPIYFFEEENGYGYNANLDTLLFASTTYDESRLINKYVITTLYDYSIYVNIILVDGSRVEQVYLAGNNIYDINNYADFTSFANGLSSLSEKEINIDNNSIMLIKTNKLKETENFSKNADNIYEISNANDLLAYKYLIDNSTEEINAILTNNIDITGYKIHFDSLTGTLNGNGYSINGFTRFTPFNYSNERTSNENPSFISHNYANISNLNFDNVAINIKNLMDSSFAIIAYNYGYINNVGILAGQININIHSPLIATISSLVGESTKSSAENLDYSTTTHALENILSNAKLNITSSFNLEDFNQPIFNSEYYPHIYVGGVVGSLTTKVDGIEFNGSLNIDSNLLKIGNKLSIGMLIGYASLNDLFNDNIEIYNGINNVSFDETTSINNFGYVMGDLLIQNGYKNKLHIKNIINKKQLGSDKNLISSKIKLNQNNELIDSQFTNVVVSSIKTIVNETDYNKLLTYLNDNFKDSKFKVAYKYYENLDKNLQAKILLPFTVQLIDVSTQLNSNTRSEGIVSKVNGFGDSYNINFTLYNNLTNRTAFKSVNFIEQIKELNFNIKVECKGIDSTNDFIILDTGAVYSSVMMKTDNKHFEIEAKEVKANYKLRILRASQFTENDLNEIFAGISIIVNDDTTNVSFDLSNQDNLYDYYIVNFAKVLRFNDVVNYEFNLPAVAKLANSNDGGINIQGTGLVADSKGQRYYNYSLELNNNNAHLKDNIYWKVNNEENNISMPSITATIDRSAFNLIFDLNKQELYEKEKPFIKFDTDFIDEQNLLAGETIATLDSENSDLLHFMIIPKMENGIYVYHLPEIYGILDYEFNGIHYHFKGFVDENSNLYYNENFDKVFETIKSGLRLYAVWDSVEYVIKTNTLSDALYVVDANGYNLNLEKTIKFGEQVTIPTLARSLYASSFIYNGYKIGEEFISTGTFDKANNSTILDTIYENYKYFDSFYASHADIDNIVTIIPDYTEVVYTIEFDSNNLNDGYKTYLLYENEEHNIVTFEWTISDVLAGVTLPVAFKEHHDFYRYIKLNDADDLINFDFQNEIFTTFIKNGFDVTSNIEKLLILNYGLNVNENISYNYSLDKYSYDIKNVFLANYIIRKVDVTIYNIDYNNLDKVLDYSIENYNSLSSIPYEIVKTEFNNNDCNVITFKVDYNTNNFILPEYKLTDENYNTYGFMVSVDKTSYVQYNPTYKFVGFQEENDEYQYKVDIFLLCAYKVNYFTKGGEISSNYATSLNKVINGEYYLFTQYNSLITLPTKDEVYWSGRDLIGFKIISENVNENISVQDNQITINEPTDIMFEYDLQLYTITIDSNGAIFPDKIDGSAFKVISDYLYINESTIQVKVYYGTLVQDVKNVLPGLSIEHYTHVGYVFNETDIITRNDDYAYADFVKNEYVIQIYNYDNTLGLTIAKNVDDLTIDEVYIPQNIDGLTFVGLSLNKNYLKLFNLPLFMPNLSKEYNITPSGEHNNIYVLNLFAYYISQVNVNILGTPNSMIKNTTNLNEFVGGDAYGASARFKLTAENVVTKNFKFPIPTVQGELLFATFIGYSTIIDGESVIVVDAYGNVLDTFVFLENVELKQEFEFNEIDFMVFASDISSALELNDFTKVVNGYSKKIQMNSEIGLLPKLSSSNYVFKGYYITEDNNTDIFVTNSDIQIADENGVLSEDYKILTTKYFNVDATLKTIVAKFDYIYVNVALVSSNTSLGVVNPINYANGNTLTNASVENGYTVKIPVGSRIEISTFVNETVAKFKCYTLSNDITLTNVIAIIDDIHEDLTIVAEFEYVEFTITYIIDGNEVASFVDENGDEINLEPKTFNFETSTFNLPTYYKKGYDFVGWYLNLSQGGEYLNLITQVVKNTNNNLTVYGKLKEKVITATIYESLDGYKNIVETIQVTYNTIISLLPANKNGYDFIGYFTEIDGRGIKISNSSLCIFDNNLNLYAYYKEIVQTVELSGQGTLSNPYKISNTLDFEYFAYLINNSNEFNNSGIYFTLTNHINLENEIYIKNFKANFNGNGFVIYAKDKIASYNELLSDGNIIRKFGLFNENEGNIENLILAVIQTEILDLELASLSFVGTICGTNIGNINNCIVYFNINSAYETLNFNSISNNIESGEITNCSIYESKTTLNMVESNFDNLLDLHSHNKTNNQPLLVDNKYLITKSEELAYVLSLTDCTQEISLQNDIDMKGKVIKNIDYSLLLNGNGYTIYNLIVLNKEYLFNSVNFVNVAIENLVFINNTDSSYIINVSQNIEKTYIKTSINTSKFVVNENNGTIKNAYFITNTDAVVDINNGIIENVYTVSGKIIENYKVNDVVINAVVLNINSDTLYLDVEAFMNESTIDNEIWFIDANNIMGNGNLPALINVGNYVFEMVYDNTILTPQSLPYNLINNKFIARVSLELVLSFEMLQKEYAVSDILIDSVSFVNNLINKSFSVLTYNFDGNYHIVEIIAELKSYNVTIIAQAGGQIEVDGMLYEEYSQSVLSGTTITAKVITNEGYTFIGWDDGWYDTEIVQNTTRTETILSDIYLMAKFERLNKYSLFVEQGVTIDEEELNAYFTWTKDTIINDEGTSNENLVYVYTTYISTNISQEELINDYLQINPISKDYQFIDFFIENVIDKNFNLLENDFNIYLVFEPRYLNVFLDFDDLMVDVQIVSEIEDNIAPSSGLDIVKKFDNTYYSILYGYNVLIKGTPNGAYLTHIVANSINLVDDYSAIANKDIPFEITYKVIEQTDIVITMKPINLITTFEYDNEIVTLKMQNGSLNASNEVIVSKNTELLFSINFEQGYELDKFEVYNINNELLEVEILEIDGVYSYVVNEVAIIKIYHKQIVFNVDVYASVGGEVLTDFAEFAEIESDEFETAFNMILTYGESVTIFANPDSNYIISSIFINDKEVSASQILKLNNITENKKIVINFKKVEAWLDESDGKLNFALSTFVGLGTKANPYIISSKNDILTIAYMVNKQGETFDGVYFKALKTNMILDFIGYYFDPIGTDNVNFNGIILGDNLTLRNINITGGSNIGLFKTLGSNAIVRGITLVGSVTGNDLVGSICGTNNGLLEGVVNKMNITTYNGVDRETNIVGGICAINNGVISRSNNSGSLKSSAVKISGISAINTGKIENIYNDGQIESTYNITSIMAGLVAENNGNVKFGYNSSRVYSSIQNVNLIISGTSLDKAGESSELYFNSTKLTTTLGVGKTYDELKGIASKTNPLYAAWDFVNIWGFKNDMFDLPKLKEVVEFKANIEFSVEFGEGFDNAEKIVIIEVSNNLNANYTIVLTSSSSKSTLKGLAADTYSINVISIIGATITNNTSELILEEGVYNTNINIVVAKSTINGYHASVII